MQDLVKPAPANAIKKVRKQMESEFTVNGNLDYSSITEALMQLTDGREPRNVFISGANLMRKLTRYFASSNGRKSFKKIPGFKNEDEAFEHIYRLRQFFIAMANWRVDGYINLVRLQQGRKNFTVGEIAALKDLYVDRQGLNDEYVEQIITAELYEAGMRGEAEELLSNL